MQTKYPRFYREWKVRKSSHDIIRDYYLTQCAKKEKNRISREDLKKAVNEFIKKGGIIQKYAYIPETN